MELQSDSENKNFGKSPGIFATVFLILFATPFAAFGVFALVQGVRKWAAGNLHDGPPLCIFGFIFSLAGFGLMTGAILSRKKLKQKAELEARFAGKPWMMRADWAEGKIKSSTLAQPKILLLMGIAFCVIGGISTFFGLPEVWQKHNYAALLILLFPLAGLGMLAAFFIAWRSQKRFGDCFFELAQIPVPLGGVLEGMIQTGKPVKLEHELNLKFSCIRRVTTGSGKNRSTNDYVLWQDERIYSEQAALPQTGTGTDIPVHFKLPANQPECYSRGNESVFWRLEAKSKLRGPNFHAIFEVPVFKTADASVATGADDSDPTAAFAAPIEEIRRDENSKIKISDGPNGREFYFPAARNPGAATVATTASIVCIGIAAVSFHASVHAGLMILFPAIFGLVGIFAFFGAVSLWFKSSRVTINSTNVCATDCWLVCSRAREFSAGDVTRFATKTGMQSGSRTFTDIRLIKRGADEDFEARRQKFQNSQNVTQLIASQVRQAAGPSGVTVASSIASIAEANWLVAEMNKALGA